MMQLLETGITSRQMNNYLYGVSNRTASWCPHRKKMIIRTSKSNPPVKEVEVNNFVCNLRAVNIATETLKIYRPETLSTIIM